MALARSMSGPSGLSINTNSANNLFGSGTTPAQGGMFGSTQASKPGGLFGSTTTAPQSGGLFGSTSSSAPVATGLFGSTSSAPASTGLFGSTSTTQPASGGLFGSAAPTQQPGGLFGSTQPTTQQSTGGLFGAAPASTQPQSGGLFGNSTAVPQAGGLFGSNTNTQTQQSGGLFGNNPAPSGGLFGGLNQQQNQPQQPQQTQNQPASTSLFASLGQSTQTQQPQAQQQPSMFSQTQGGGLGGFGGRSLGVGQQNQQQQVVPGVRIDMANIRGTTRFNDLHEELQKQITDIDSFIQRQILLSNECQAIMPSHESQLLQVPHDYEFCRRKKIGLENGQDSDIQSIAQAAQLVRADADNATLSFRAIDNLKLPPQYHNSGMWSNPSSDGSSKTDGDAQDIVGFFSKTADDLKNTLDKYQGHVTEIEQHLRGVEAASAQQINALVARQHGSSRTQVDPVEDLAAVLREFEQSLLGVAGRVGGAREAVQSAQLDGFISAPNGRSSTNGSGNGSRRGIY